MPTDSIDNFQLNRSSVSANGPWETIATILDKTTVIEAFTVPADYTTTVTINVQDSSWIQVGEYINVATAGLFIVDGKLGQALSCRYVNATYNDRLNSAVATNVQVLPGSFVDSATPNPTFWYQLVGKSANNITITYNVVTITVSNNPGAFMWVQVWGSSNSDNATAVKVDAQGNVICVGTYGGNAYVKKFNSAGTLLWETQSFGNNACFHQAVALDSQGNIYVCGFSFGTWFPTDPRVPGSVQPQPPIGLTGAERCVIAKYNSSGTVLWAQSVNPGVASETSFGYGIAYHEPTDSVWVCGSCQGTVNFGSGNVTAQAATAVMIFKLLGSTGAFTGVGNLYGEATGAATIDSARGICLDPSGGIVVTGDFNSSSTAGGITFGNGLPIMRINDPQDGATGFLVRFNSSFQAQWQKQFGYDFRVDTGYAVDMNQTTQEIYVCGLYRGLLDLGNGVTLAHGTALEFYSQAFGAKFQGDGTALWAKRWSGSMDVHDYGRCVKVCNNGDVFFGGQISGSCDFGGGMRAAGSQDAFVVRYDSNGVFRWVRTIGAITTDWAFGVTVDSLDNVYLVGSWFGGGSYGTVDFGDGIGRSSTLSNSLPTSDAYVVKYSA